MTRKDAGKGTFTDRTIDNTGLVATPTWTAGTQTNLYYNVVITASNGSHASSHGIGGQGGSVSYPTQVTDTFGNSIMVPSYGVYTDTLGTTVLTGSPFSTQLTWTDTNGNPQSVIYSSGSYTQQFVNCGYTLSNPVVLPNSYSFPDGTNIAFTWESQSAGTKTGRIASITNHTGGTTSFSYGAMYCGPSGHGPAYPTTLTVTTPDGSYVYTMGTAPSRVTTVLDPGKNKTVYTFNGDITGIFPTAAILTQVQKYQNTGTVASPVYTLLTTDLICYNGNSSNCATASVFFPITERDIYHTIADMSASSRTQIQYDTSGNKIFVARYDFGASNYTTAISTRYGSWNGSTCAAVGSNVFNLPCDVVTSDGTHTLAETRYTYNSQGAMTAKSEWTGTNWLTTTYVPNSNGTTASKTEPNGLVTTYAYNGVGGCNSLLPTSQSTTVNGVVLSSSKTWNCNGGVVLTTTDENGDGTVMHYDALFRPSFRQDESGYQTTIGYTRNSASRSASFGTSVQNHTTYVDTLSRPIVSQDQQGPSSGNYDTTSFTYSFNGTNRQVQSSSPCPQTSGLPCSTYGTTLADLLGRPISFADALGGIKTYTYSQNDTSATVGPAPPGENVKTVQTEVDGLGRTKSVCSLQTSGGTACGQAMGNAGILTTFAYSFGPGTSTVTATRGSQTHTTISDALSRAISVQTPERGTVTNYYDSVSGTTCASSPPAFPGKLIATKDNAGQYICYWYDSLGRVTDIANTYQTISQPCKRFRYGDGADGFMHTAPTGWSAANSIGRVAEASTDGCNLNTDLTDEWFAYDKNGRMTDMWEYTPTSKVYYHTQVSYYPNGMPNTLSGLPGYGTLTYGVDGEGRWYTATLGTVTVVSGVTYDAANRPTLVKIGSGTDQDTYAYDLLERMKQYQFFVGAQSNKGVLNWNPSGSLQSLAITDGFNSADTQTCTFTYDDIRRLTGDNCGTVWSQTYSYDQYDNLTKSGSASFGCAGCYNPANNQFQTIGTTYDGNGNLTYDGSANHYTWDAYGKMVTVNGATVTYDAFGRPVAGPSGEILYTPLGKVGVLQTSTRFWNAYVPLPGGGAISLGCCSSDNIWYLHRDWLGTSRVISGVPASGNGSVYNDRSFSPYGDEYQNSGYNDPLFFAGMNADLFATSGTGSILYDTPNRELAANASRWLSPDPAGASWNAYAYGTDPNTGTDPEGLLWISSDSLLVDPVDAPDPATDHVTEKKCPDATGNACAPAQNKPQYDPKKSGPEDPTNPGHPLSQNPVYKKASDDAWQKTTNGTARNGRAEAGGTIEYKDGKIYPANQVNSVNGDAETANHLQITTDANTIAIYHTHGNSLDPRPSPGDRSPNTQVPDFVRSQRSLYVTIPGTAHGNPSLNDYIELQ